MTILEFPHFWETEMERRKKHTRNKIGKSPYKTEMQPWKKALKEQSREKSNSEPTSLRC